MTIKVYFDPISKGFYQSDIHKKVPSTAVEITDKKRWELIAGQSEGKVITVAGADIGLKEPDPITEDPSIPERAWRNTELNRADVELYKVQDSDPKAVGTVAGWREYRKTLRAWPEQEEFPNKEKRPVSPDA